jgi:hypothetical protein
MPKVIDRQWPVNVLLSPQDLKEILMLAMQEASPLTREKWRKLIVSWMAME